MPITSEPSPVTCPSCNAGLLRPGTFVPVTHTITSWTDMRGIGPELGDAPVYACPKCGWVGADWPKRVRASSDSPFLKHLDLAAMLAFVDSRERGDILEAQVRAYVWRRSNDPIRNGGPPELPLECHYRNIARLAALCGPETPNPHAVLMKAELLRELGDFRGAIDLLGRLPQGQWVGQYIRDMAEAGDVRVREVFVYPSESLCECAKRRLDAQRQEDMSILRDWDSKRRSAGSTGFGPSMVIAAIPTAALWILLGMGAWSLLPGLIIMGAVHSLVWGKTAAKKEQEWVKSHPRPESKLPKAQPTVNPNFPVQGLPPSIVPLISLPAHFPPAPVVRTQAELAQSAAAKPDVPRDRKAVATELPGIRGALCRIFDSMQGRATVMTNDGGYDFVFASPLITLKGELKIVPENTEAELRCLYYLSKPLSPEESLTLLPIIGGFNEVDSLIEWSVMGECLEIRARAVSQIPAEDWVPEFLKDILPFAAICSALLIMGRDKTWSADETISAYREAFSKRRDVIAAKQVPEWGIIPGNPQLN